MIKDIFQYIILFVILILVQVLLLNQMNLSVYVNPYLYILFILMLPFETPGWLLLFLGFITGISIDFFTNTAGMHASACVFLAFVRPYLLSSIAPRDGYEFGLKPHAKQMGWIWFITYVAIGAILHHLFLFFVEAYTFTNFFLTLLKAILSSILTIVLLLISELLIYNR